MNKALFKFAASTMIVSLTMVATTAQSEALRRAQAESPAEARAVREAGALNERARRALQQGQLGEAQTHIEQAVALSPRDAGYRLLLADVYLKQGRFESARDTYADVLELDSSNVRAGLSFSLMQIALGRPSVAVAQLDSMVGHAPDADVGLAFALAGVPQRAIEILESAARAHDATPRVRQNLALSYAIAGDWRRARTIAAQDLPPSEVGRRMVQWAEYARPNSGPTQVAGLLGVNPVADPGQPVRLALRNATPLQLASASPAAAPAFAEAGPAPAATASAPAPASDSDWGRPAPEARTYYTAAPAAPPAPAAPAEPAAPAAPDEARAVRAAVAARTLTRPSPAFVRTASVSLPPAPVFERARPRAVAPAVRAGSSRFVVQLGAFSNEGNAERAWLDAQRRFDLGARAPLTATINHQGRTLHRVAISGFASQADAGRMCSAIRARGGVCFVRASAGDASIRWAARYANGRTRDA